MKGKTLATSATLILLSGLTACSSSDRSFSARTDDRPAVVNNSNNNTSATASPGSATDSTTTASAGRPLDPPAPPPTSATSGTATGSGSTGHIISSMPGIPTAGGIPPVRPTVLFVQQMAEGGRGDNTITPDTLNEKPGAVIYNLGNDLLRLSNEDTVNTRLSSLAYDESVFINDQQINANSVQTLKVMDKGKEVGEFKFLKQSADAIAITFLPQIEQLKEDGAISAYVPMASYIAKPTSDAEFSKLTGSASYTGKVIGYNFNFQSGDHHSFNDSSSRALTRPVAAEANIALSVNFDTKKITGTVTNRFDNLASRRQARFLADDDKLTAEYLALDKKDFILDADIKKSGDIWGFQGATNGTEGVAVMTDASTKQNITGWGGIFAGTNASEVVGVIGLGEEKMSFGAQKQANPPAASAAN